MTISKSIFSTVLALCAGTVAAFSTTVNFSATDGNEKYQMWGTQKSERYDVAIHIDNPALVGKPISGVKVPFITSDVFSDITVWLSTDLVLDKDPETGKKVNMPDMASVAAVSTGNVIDASFDKTYVIPEGGLYVGYSFTVDGSGSVANYPVTTVKGTGECGFFVHSSRQYLKWKDLAETEGRVAAMTVVLEGDFPESAASPVAAPPTIAQVDREIQLPVVVRNDGSSMIYSLDYAVKIAGEENSYHIDYEHGILPYYLGSSSLYLPVDGVSGTGRADFSFTILKVNGVENPSAANVCESYIDIAEYCPVNRPLVEEYTGLGCGWCPRGIAAFERMSSLYPGLFVGVAFHEGDDITAEGQRPNSPSGQPAAYINRTLACDPYCGTDNSGFGIEELWNSFREASVPVGIDVDLEWADDEKTLLNVSTDVVYVAPAERKVALAYLLLADDISNPNWFQSNYYSGTSGVNMIPELQKFIDSPSIIIDMKFNDIVAMQTNPKGVEGSLPDEIQPYEIYNHKYQFDVTKGVSTRGYLLAQNPDKLKVVAVVVDTETGEAINCNTASTDALSAHVGEITEALTLGSSWYDLSGRKVTNPSGGIFIRVDEMKGGSRRVSKVVM